ncbi:hypothetical protein AB0M36_30540 [Actinoplanes sp. NPDC051346]|uniref:hypothetical protein n=1 Tax=Actinoplanes sp. NPDC051346 TaxID=3155048 RepID=UPI00343D3C64
MSADLDQVLSKSLQQRADAGSPIDPQPLLHVAVARGRRMRARRRAATLLAAAAIAGTAVITVWLPSQHATTPVSPAPSPSAALDVDLAKLPAADGQPGAAARPDLVGSDPGLLHFSVDTLATARRVAWTSAPGLETADVQRTDFQVYVALAQSQQRFSALPLAFSSGPRTEMSAPVGVSLGDREATLSTSRPWKEKNGLEGRIYAFEWQPVSGLWARVEVQTTSQERAEQILRQVRFDQTRRCVLPFRPSSLPAGATVPDCDVALAQDSPAVFRSGGWTVVDGQRRLSVQAHAFEPDTDDDRPPLKAGPYHAYADPDGRSWTMRVDGLLITATVETRKNPFTQAEVLQILGGLHIAEQVPDPGTW